MSRQNDPPLMSERTISNTVCLAKKRLSNILTILNVRRLHLVKFPD
jgi:hypothetical protein